MVAVELIGNLGSNAEIVKSNGSEFVSFNVCDNRKVGNKEIQQWYTCNLNKSDSKIVPCLTKGQGVFVRGVPVYRIFDSAKYHCKMMGISILVNEIHLVGGKPQEKDAQTEQPAPGGNIQTAEKDALPF